MSLATGSHKWGAFGCAGCPTHLPVTACLLICRGAIPRQASLVWAGLWPASQKAGGKCLLQRELQVNAPAAKQRPSRSPGRSWPMSPYTQKVSSILLERSTKRKYGRDIVIRIGCDLADSMPLPPGLGAGESGISVRSKRQGYSLALTSFHNRGLPTPQKCLESFTGNESLKPAASSVEKGMCPYPKAG